MTETKLHSPIGPSSAYRYFNCPGSVRVTKNHKSKPSKYSAEGTLAHSLVEACLTAGHNAHIYDDTEHTIGEFDIHITEELVDAIQFCVDETKKMQKRSTKMYLEQELAMHELDPNLFGTADAILVKKERLAVVDYKFGKGIIVDVENNHQLRGYAVGSLLSLPPEEANGIEYVDTIIIQPRVSDDNEKIRIATYTRAEIDHFAVEWKEAILRTKLSDAPLVAGPWCRKTFCPAQATCPAARNEVVKDVLARTGADLIVDRVTPPDPRSLTPEELSTILNNAEKIQQWCTAVKEYALDSAQRGLQIPGYKLTERKGHRKWRDEKEVVEKYSEEFGDAIYNTPKMKSPAQLEKIIGKKRKQEVDQLCERNVSGYALVPFNSARPGKITKAQQYVLLSDL